MPASPRVCIVACCAVFAAVVAACTAGDESSTSTIPLPNISALPTTTDAATTTTAATATTLPDTSPVATTAPPTLAPTLPSTTTTTEPIAVQELVLRGDGLGSARFGAAPEGVIDYVSSILGASTADTGWVDPFAFAVCEGEIARRVDWGVLSLLFSDLSDFAAGRRHFMGYEYGRVGQIGDEPVGLRTPGGTTLGSRVVDLLADFPDASLNPGEEGINIPPNFYESNYFYGLMTGIEAEDVVTVIFGGYGCGE